jgi:hypothetical protein
MLCDLDAVISLRSNSMHSRSLNHDFPITRGLLLSVYPLLQRLATMPVLLVSLRLLLLLQHFAAASPATAPLATATDDLSLGFLQRTVQPSTAWVKVK